MSPDDWKAFLTEFNQELLASDKLRQRVDKSAVETGWLGCPGASNDEIAALEKRLGTTLPPSYRSFLQCTDGWRQTGFFIDRLWPCSQVAWFKERNQNWIDAYNEGELTSVSDADYFVYGKEQDTCVFREEYLKTALEISDVGDDCTLLLNPRIVTPDGEWEAWLFANWYPGAARYRSFRELMEHERESFRQMAAKPGK